MGAGAARVHTWDGTKWVFTSDWLEADMAIINPMVKAAADKYAAGKGLKRRPATDCSS
jgi:branched-chain amino acid transport system substrate-binding protein